MKLRKNRIQFVVGFIALLAITFIAGLSNQETSLVHASQMQGNDIRVAVIAGHGDIINKQYQTYGKQSPEWPDGLKIYEGRSTHDLALRLVLKLRDADIDAEIINPELRDITLRERVARCNRLYLLDKRTVCIFLHHNAQSTAPEYCLHLPDYCDEEGYEGWFSIASGGATGIEVFTSIGHTKSDPLATAIIEELKTVFPDIRMRKDIRDGDLDKEANFYVLKYTYGPAVLIEFMFMTTYSDCEVIADPVSREKYLDAIVCGILKYAEQ